MIAATSDNVSVFDRRTLNPRVEFYDAPDIQLLSWSVAPWRRRCGTRRIEGNFIAL
jgi:hypothetical protein